MDKFKSMSLFCRVVELGSFAAVAREEALSATMVGKYVTSLERKLGSSLLIRTTRRLHLTEAGRIYFERCRRLMEDLEELEFSVNRLGHGIVGELAIAAPIDFGQMYLIPALECFRKDYPDIRISLMLENNYVDLREGGIDLLIRITDRPHPDLISRPIGTTALCTYASPRYLSQHGYPENITNLHQHRCLGFINTPHKDQWLFQQNGQVTEFRDQWYFASNNGIALCKAAAMGVGIIQVPNLTAAPFVAGGQLEEILKGYCVRNLPIYTCYLQRRFIPAKISTLVEFLQHYFEQGGHISPVARITTKPDG